MTPLIPPASKQPLHPLLMTAAVAVLLFCSVGIAALMDWLPSSAGHGAPAATQTLSAPPGDTAAPAGHGAAGAATPLPESAPLPPAPPPGASLGENQYAAAPASSRDGGARYVAQTAAAPAVCHHCGVVEAVRTIRTRAEGSGVGAAGGAVVGGLLGHQIGGGSGRNLATIAGAIGGAVVGNQVEGNMNARTSYEVTVRLDDGKRRTFHSAAAWQQGERIRIVKGQLRRG
ncbi:glycine zipper 2TM domain-containing protein [Massilia sp. BJB1822]|uniref:glycine zipper 2TM domain-containing protein n=1 Tax=Massilia sp. BJB1822 TaxID=2744470 RepID=UPI001592D674|nr:glycine zipper 2TM domain-containing protein [Massilia sp. BJB1822]NVE01646.1 glycine zipper 2TM domain-containing protein [Massilia sp. BJB1822]